MRTAPIRSVYLLLLTAAALVAPAQLSAQSLTASRGLGLPVIPADARAHGLGGAALGLMGADLSWFNPAAAVNLPAPTLALNFQLDAFDAEFGADGADGTTARFPLIQSGVLLGRLALTAGYGGFLDQNWGVEQADTVLFGGDSVLVLDRFTSEGGVARLRFGAGYPVIEGLALGVGVDVFTGSVQRRTQRFFGSTQPECCEARWSYSGVGMLASVDWTGSDAVRVSAALETGTTLTAEPRDSIGEHREFEVPASYMIGASGRLTSNTLLSLSGRWQGWSETDAPLAEVGGAGDSWAVTGGVEWDGASFFGRPLPLRIGGRYSELPFRWETDPLTERAVTAGTGIQLAGGAAYADLAAERGTRGSDGDFDESYWRVLFSIRILGR